MAEQGQGDADDELDPVALGDRRCRAGRLGYISFAVEAQRTLAGMSALIRDERLRLEEAGVPLTDKQKDKIAFARHCVLDAADNLHSVAAELVGEMRKGS